MPEKLTEKRVRELVEDRTRPRPFAARDSVVPGLLLVVNKKSASWTFQSDLWIRRRLVKTVRVKVGDPEFDSVKQAREAAQEMRRLVRRGVDPVEERRPKGVTLEAATASYIDEMRRRGRSQRSIDGLRYCVDKYLHRWRSTPLAELGADARAVRQRHIEITRRHGPVCANHVMRAFRAIYHHEERVDDGLPRNPVSRAVTFNPEKRRTAPFSTEGDGLREWWAAVHELSPVRRAFNLLGLTTGSRPGALSTARRDHVDLDRAVLHIPSPKGGAERAYDIPLCEWQCRLVEELLEVGEKLSPKSPWLFPSPAAKSGHLCEWKQGEPALRGRTGHSLRHAYRTIAQEAGVSELDVKLLLNHALGDVTSRYLSRAHLLGHLRQCQESIVRHILRAVGEEPREDARTDEDEPVEDTVL